MRLPLGRTRHPAQRARRRLHGLGLWWTFAASLVLSVALIIAIVENSHQVRLHFLSWHLNVSLIVVILATALIAVLLDELGGLIWRRRRRTRIGHQHELTRLRNQQQPPEAAPTAEPAPAQPPSPHPGAETRPAGSTVPV